MQVPTNLVDGQPSDVIAVANRGLAYGDGLFETILFQDFEPILWERHWRRLARGCEVLELDLADGKESSLLEECRWLIRQNEIVRAVLKIILVRDSTGRGYRSDTSASLHTIVSISDVTEHASRNYRSGVKAWLCRTRLSVNPQLAGIKHLNRLEQVLASREWPGASYSEGIMMDSFGHIIEGTRSNVFFVRDGALVTPAIEGSGVAGVMREYLLDRAPELGLSATESLVCRADLPDFQEAFLCNSVFGIWPLISLDLATDDTLHWNPGGITLALQQTVADRLGLKMNVENRR